MTTPLTEDPITGPWFRGLLDGKFTCQRCNACEEYRWPPLPVCPECRTPGGDWVEVRPTGTVWSHVTYHRALQRSLADQVPYAVLVIDLDDGPQIVGRLQDLSTSPEVGARVEAVFVTDGDEPDVRWRLV